MKNINNYIVEKLLIAPQEHNEFPTTRKELRDIIKKRIEKEGPECDLNDIDVTNIEDMSYLFDATLFLIFKNFNGDISNWDVSNVKNTSYMFFGCKKFNCDISNWDVSAVENAEHMFEGCKNFNCDISDWRTPKLIYANNMFERCENFNQDLSKWKINSEANTAYMFYKSQGGANWYK